MSKELDQQRRKMAHEHEVYERLMRLAKVPIGGRIRSGNGLMWERVDDDAWVPRHLNEFDRGVNEEVLPIAEVLERVKSQYGGYDNRWPSTHFDDFTVLEEVDGEWKPVPPDTVVFRVRVHEHYAHKIMTLVDGIPGASYSMEVNGS